MFKLHFAETQEKPILYRFSFRDKLFRNKPEILFQTACGNLILTHKGK